MLPFPMPPSDYLRLGNLDFCLDFIFLDAYFYLFFQQILLSFVLLFPLTVCFCGNSRFFVVELKCTQLIFGHLKLLELKRPRFFHLGVVWVVRVYDNLACTQAKNWGNGISSEFLQTPRLINFFDFVCDITLIVKYLFIWLVVEVFDHPLIYIQIFAIIFSLIVMVSVDDTVLFAIKIFGPLNDVFSLFFQSELVDVMVIKVHYFSLPSWNCQIELCGWVQTPGFCDRKLRSWF